MRILFSGISTPITPAVYIERAFRKKHEVIKYGAALTRDLLASWGVDYESVKDKLTEPEIPYYTQDLGSVLKKLPWTPDLFFYTDTHVWYSLEGIRTLPCPTACWLIDTYTGPRLYRELARRFDHVFLSDRLYIPEFRAAGIENISWLPLACDPAVQGRRPGPKLYDISFVGTVKGRRGEIIRKLGEKFSVHYETCFYEQVAEVYSRSKIVLHLSPVDTVLSTRVFEAMASGSMLLADRAEASGLQDFFEDRKHLVCYENDEEMMELAAYYLTHEREREEIAATGMNEVLAKHTYDHRVRTLMDSVSHRSDLKRPVHTHTAEQTDSEARLRQLIKSGPENAGAHFDLGIILQEKGEFDSAVTCFRTAIDLKPGFINAYNRLGITLKDQGKLDEALACYAQAIEHNAGDYTLYNNLGSLFHLKNQLDRALKCYEKSLELKPDNGPAYFNLSALLRDRGLYEESKFYYMKALECFE